jgi:hypothetical protein
LPHQIEECDFNPDRGFAIPIEKEETMAGRSNEQRRSLNKLFEKERPSFLSKALDDAKKWCPAPETLVGDKRADQFWLRLFSTASKPVTPNDAYCFLVSFQLTNRVKWDRDAVAAEIDRFCREQEADVGTAISMLAVDLSGCRTSARKGRRISAASKIAFFTKPSRDVYIWDQFAKESAGFRECKSPAFRDYSSYSDTCATVQAQERGRGDFVAALQEFQAFLKGVGGPMTGTRIIRNSSFIERRFLDKLMFWEGKWLKERLGARA